VEMPAPDVFARSFNESQYGVLRELPSHRTIRIIAHMTCPR
jgi:hypothetical protein